MVSSLIVSSDNQQEVVRYVLPQCTDFHSAVGVYKNKVLIGGVVYLNYYDLDDKGHYSIDGHVAGKHGWLTKNTLKELFSYPFLKLNCSRIVGCVKGSNSIAIKILDRIGAKLDGIVRSGISSDFDTYIYTITRQDCSWIVK